MHLCIQCLHIRILKAIEPFPSSIEIIWIFKVRAKCSCTRGWQWRNNFILIYRFFFCFFVIIVMGTHIGLVTLLEISFYFLHLQDVFASLHILVSYSSFTEYCLRCRTVCRISADYIGKSTSLTSKVCEILFSEFVIICLICTDNGSCHSKSFLSYISISLASQTNIAFLTLFV